MLNWEFFHSMLRIISSLNLGLERFRKLELVMKFRNQISNSGKLFISVNWPSFFSNPKQ